MKLASLIKKIRFYISILFDRKTPWYARIFILTGLAYLLLPQDFLPDYIPFLGVLDDISVGMALIILALRFVPDEVINSKLWMSE